MLALAHENMRPTLHLVLSDKFTYFYFNKNIQMNRNKQTEKYENLDNEKYIPIFLRSLSEK